MFGGKVPDRWIDVAPGMYIGIVLALEPQSLMPEASYLEVPRKSLKLPTTSHGLRAASCMKVAFGPTVAPSRGQAWKAQPNDEWKFSPEGSQPTECSEGHGGWRLGMMRRKLGEEQAQESLEWGMGGETQPSGRPPIYA